MLIFWLFPLTEIFSLSGSSVVRSFSSCSRDHSPIERHCSVRQVAQEGTSFARCWGSDTSHSSACVQGVRTADRGAQRSVWSSLLLTSMARKTSVEPTLPQPSSFSRGEVLCVWIFRAPVLLTHQATLFFLPVLAWRFLSSKATPV